jgi:hypothetical protein
VAFYLILPLVFVTLFLSMYVGLRVRLLRKEIAGLELCRESLAVRIYERRRQLAREVGFAVVAPQAQRRGLHPPEPAQILALARETEAPASEGDLTERVLEFLTRAPEAQARPLPIGSARRRGASE